MDASRADRRATHNHGRPRPVAENPCVQAWKARGDPASPPFGTALKQAFRGDFRNWKARPGCQARGRAVA